MPKASAEAKTPVWLPNPARIVEQIGFLPPRSGVRAHAPTAAGAPPAYRILRTDEVDAYDAPVARARVAALAAKAKAPSDSFAGTDRKVAKLSIAKAKTENFSDLSELVKTLPSIDRMKKHDPKITKDEDCDRVDEEVRNVKLRAFLYAASREGDNDFHFIVGRDPKLKPLFLTMELSGLPPKSSPAFKRLKAARDAYKTFLGDKLPGETYDFYDPPVPIEVEGSLFFDVTHATGSRPGPKKLKTHMPTVWEVHPISRIVFEP